MVRKLDTFNLVIMSPFKSYFKKIINLPIVLERLKGNKKKGLTSK